MALTPGLSAVEELQREPKHMQYGAYFSTAPTSCGHLPVLQGSEGLADPLT